MDKESVVWIVGTELTDNSITDTFNQWYDEQHLPFLTSTLPQIRKAERYKAIENQKHQPSYVAVYHLDDLAAYREIIASPIIGEVKEDWEKQWNKKASIRLSWLYKRIY